MANAAQAETILAEGERVDGSSLVQGHGRRRALRPLCRPRLPDGLPQPLRRRQPGLHLPLPDQGRRRRRRSPWTTSWPGPAAHLPGEHGPGDPGPGRARVLPPQRQRPELVRPAQKQQGYHSSAPFIKSGPILNEMVRHITQITGAVKYAHSEVGFVDSVQSDLPESAASGPSSWRSSSCPGRSRRWPTTWSSAAGSSATSAYKYGCVATFTPKIEEGVAGNGLHYPPGARRGRQERHDRRNPDGAAGRSDGPAPHRRPRANTPTP